MSLDERLMESMRRKPSEERLRNSRARLDALFRQRFEQREALRNDQRSQTKSQMDLLRNLAKGDSGIQEAIKRARERSITFKDRSMGTPKRLKVKARAHRGSIGFTYDPSLFSPWQWGATTGSDAFSTLSVDATAGTMSAWCYTGQNGKTVSCAVAVGCYFGADQLSEFGLGDTAIMEVSANPAVAYSWGSFNTFDSSHTGGFIGLYVGEYTPEGEFVQGVVDQQIGLWNSGGGIGEGSSSGYPLFASTPIDILHYYDIWVWSGTDAEADGWSAFWGSAADGGVWLTVSSISAYAY
jgi:hypothetical protein